MLTVQEKDGDEDEKYMNDRATPFRALLVPNLQRL